MAVKGLFGERESGEQVNCVVSSMHQACPLYAQLLTYRCGAANRRFGPTPGIASFNSIDYDDDCCILILNQRAGRAPFCGHALEVWYDV
jgi:hypothetical protein